MTPLVAARYNDGMKAKSSYQRSFRLDARTDADLLALADALRATHLEVVSRALRELARRELSKRNSKKNPPRPLPNGSN